MWSVFIDLAPSGLVQSLMIALVALGVMIPFRILNFPDLTSEGSYPLGGCVCAILLVHHVPPVFALCLALVCGGLTGVATALIHLKWQVNTLLAGIIVSTMLYSVDLRLMGRPNIPLFAEASLFSGLDSLTARLIVLLALNVLILLAIYAFLSTERGLRFRALGLNAAVAAQQGTRRSGYTCLGLFIGNALNATAGALMVQMQGYADVGMGIGIVIHALAAMMIGETLIGSRSLFQLLLAPLIGALIYQQIQGVAMAVGFQPSDFKLITGSLVLLTLALQRRRGRYA